MPVEKRLPTEEPAEVPLEIQSPPLRRILVVEDDGDVRRLNTALLMRSGYQVDAAEDGAVAWEALQLKHYDLLVTDNEMPKVSGVELIAKLHAASMALPVIMATGSLPTLVFTRSPWLQPAAMLTKPYTSEELLGKVKETLGAHPGVTEKIASLPAWQTQPTT